MVRPEDQYLHKPSHYSRANATNPPVAGDLVGQAGLKTNVPVPPCARISIQNQAMLSEAGRDELRAKVHGGQGNERPADTVNQGEERGDIVIKTDDLTLNFWIRHIILRSLDMDRIDFFTFNKILKIEGFSMIKLKYWTHDLSAKLVFCCCCPDHYSRTHTEPFCL